MNDENLEVQIDKPKFVIETTLDAQMHLRASTAAQPKFLSIFGYICIAICAIMGIILIGLYIETKNTTNLLYAAAMILTIAFALYTKFIAPKKQSARWEQSIARAYGSKELHLTTEFYNHSFIQTMRENEENMVDAIYSELVQLKETEDLFLIRCANSQWLFLSKNGFREGTADDFRKFINEHIGGK